MKLHWYTDIMNRRSLIVAGIIIVVIAGATGGWLYYRKTTAGTSYHKSFPSVLNAAALPSTIIRFYMLGTDIGVLSGRHEIREGKEFNEVIYTTSTSRDTLYNEYVEYFAGIHWTVTTAVNSNDILTISAHNKSGKYVTAVFTDQGSVVQGRVSLLAPLTAAPSPTPAK
jgi:hypothetical protein